MKTPLFALLILAAGCSSPKVTVMPLPAPVSPNLAERERYPELVMAYHVARYIDPNHPLLMHEAHAVYRVEGQAAWNLHPQAGSFTLPNNLGVLTNTAFVPPPANDAVIAELNRQKAVTRTVTQQAESLNGSLREFAAALTNTRNLVEQNHALRAQLTRAEHRLDVLEAELNKRPADQPREEEEIKN